MEEVKRDINRSNSLVSQIKADSEGITGVSGNSETEPEMSCEISELSEGVSESSALESIDTRFTGFGDLTSSQGQQNQNQSFMSGGRGSGNEGDSLSRLMDFTIDPDISSIHGRRSRDESVMNSRINVRSNQI